MAPVGMAAAPVAGMTICINYGLVVGDQNLQNYTLGMRNSIHRITYLYVFGFMRDFQYLSYILSRLIVNLAIFENIYVDMTKYNL